MQTIIWSMKNQLRYQLSHDVECTRMQLEHYVCATDDSSVSKTWVRDSVWSSLDRGFQLIVDFDSKNYWESPTLILGTWQSIEAIAEMAFALGAGEIVARQIISETRKAIEEIDLASESIDGAQLDLIVDADNPVAKNRVFKSVNHMLRVADQYFMRALEHDVCNRHTAAIAILSAVSYRQGVELASFSTSR